MNCLQTTSNSDFTGLAAQLFGAPVQSVELRARGANSRVYLVRGHESSAALKLYPPQDAGGLNRLRREFGSLSFLANTPLSRFVPHAFDKDEQALAALYEWIEGEPVGEHGVRDIALVAEFLASLRVACDRAAEAKIERAAEAVFSFAEAFAILDRRLSLLREQQQQYVELIPVLARLEELLTGMRATCRQRRDFSSILPLEARTLSPSDFSFHNALRQPDGTLKFIDYEHFGFDDPAKLCSDFLWHPAHVLSQDERAQFITSAVSIFGGAEFLDRWQAMFGLFGLKWALIVLNDFMPAGARRRHFSAPEKDAVHRRALQIHKANELLDRVTQRWNQEVQ